jgi:transposase
MMSPSRQSEPDPVSGFYDKLRRSLAEIAFDKRVSEICEPLYWTTYPETDLRIDPVVYFKMLMIGFLENSSSERAIAARCRDSLSVRALLGYGPTERTPGEHELCAIRDRLEPHIYEEVLEMIVASLKLHGLLDGGTIVQEIIEENANLRGLINRNTEYVCRNYFAELTKQSPLIAPSQTAAELVAPKISYRPTLAATREATLYENSDDHHQERWCRHLSRRGGRVR